MKKITAEEIVDLLFLPVTDTKVVETLDALGIEQPSLGEEYEMEGRIVIIDTDNSGLQFEFEDSSDYTEDGIPLLQQITFAEEHKVTFPLELHKSDSYETVVKKIGKKPDFCITILPSSKQWVFPYEDKEIVYTIHFKPDMSSINEIVIKKFNRKSVEKSEFILPCEEQEE